jgi:hypothetical protein
MRLSCIFLSVAVLSACADDATTVASGAGGGPTSGGGSATSGSGGAAGGSAGTSSNTGTAGQAGASGAGGNVQGTGGRSGADASTDVDGSGGTFDASTPKDSSTDGAGPQHPFDWMGIIGTGQSLSVGANGTPVLATAQPYKHLKLSLGGAVVPPFDPNATSLSLVPLVEPIRPITTVYPGAYPANIWGETPHTAMANQISAIHAKAGLGDYITVHSVVGESGQSITIIGKDAQPTSNTGLAYAASLFEARSIQRLAMAAGKTYGIGAIVLTHGETDGTRSTYEADIRKLWSDYNADLPPITGQKTPILLILSQQHSTPNTAGIRPTSTLAEWRLGVDYPNDIVCAGPKYQYQYISDETHMLAHEYDRMGEKYAQVFYERVVLGRPWHPLQPISAMRAGNVVTVTFEVPVAPLNWDDTIPPPFQTAMTEWSKGRGFELEDSVGRVAIDSVAIDGASVHITLATSSMNSGLTVRYAMTSEGPGAPTVPRRGQLRDSDTFVGTDAETISCQVTNGSAQVRAAQSGGFHRRGVRDLALGASLAAETIVSAQASDDQITLSHPWTGASGTVDLQFRSDQRNYCVAFEMAVK